MNRNMVWMAIFAIIIAGCLFWACSDAGGPTSFTLGTTSDLSSASGDAGSVGQPPTVISPVDPLACDIIGLNHAGIKYEVDDKNVSLFVPVRYNGEGKVWVHVWEPEVNNGEKVAVGPANEKFTFPLDYGEHKIHLAVEVDKDGDKSADDGLQCDTHKMVIIVTPPDRCEDEHLNLQVTLEQPPSTTVSKVYIVKVAISSSQPGSFTITGQSGENFSPDGGTWSYRYECGAGEVLVKAKTECNDLQKWVEIPSCQCVPCLDALLEHSASVSQDGKLVTIKIDSSNPGTVTLNGESKPFSAGSGVEVVFEGLELECGTKYMYSIGTSDSTCGDPVICDERNGEFSTPDCPKCVDVSLGDKGCEVKPHPTDPGRFLIDCTAVLSGGTKWTYERDAGSPTGEQDFFPTSPMTYTFNKKCEKSNGITWRLYDQGQLCKESHSGFTTPECQDLCPDVVEGCFPKPQHGNLECVDLGLIQIGNDETGGEASCTTATMKAHAVIVKGALWNNVISDVEVGDSICTCSGPSILAGPACMPPGWSHVRYCDCPPGGPSLY